VIKELSRRDQSYITHYVSQKLLSQNRQKRA